MVASHCDQGPSTTIYLHERSHPSATFPVMKLHQFPVTIDPCLEFLLLPSRGHGKTRANSSLGCVQRPQSRHMETRRDKQYPEVGKAEAKCLFYLSEHPHFANRL